MKQALFQDEILWPLRSAKRWRKKGIEHWNKVCIKQHEVTNPGLRHKTTRTVLAACYALTLVLCNWKRGSPRLLTEVLRHGEWPIRCTQLTATIEEWQMTTKHGQWLNQCWASSLWVNSASAGTPKSCLLHTMWWCHHYLIQKDI